LKAARDALRSEGPATTNLDVRQPILSLELGALPALDENASVESYDVGVSIVIPTLNGANDLVKLLPSLLHQQGFKHIEIIIVDSGSTDESVSLATTYCAKIIQLEPEKFSHSHARNIGADNATQEYLFFTVQDALLPTQTVLSQMVTFLKSEHLAAVSCKELPRMDADLYTRVENWYHYKEILKLNEIDKVLLKPETISPQSLRASAQLSNVACLISKDTFLKYRFRGEYAEDLDLGVRLVNDGAKLGIMNSVSVIHSHARPAYEYLKRGFVDKLTLAQLLSESQEHSHPSFDEFIQDIFFTGKRLKYLFSNIWATRSYYNVADFEGKLHRRMLALLLLPMSPFVRESDFDSFDDRMKVFLQQVCPQYQRKLVRHRSDGNLLRAVMAFTRIMFEYLGTTYDVLDEHIIADIRKAISQYYATLVGRCLAEWYLVSPEQEKKILEQIKEELHYGKKPWGGVRK
jgi:glycosyltransferase involved in cell wall biosynthesis